jgi:hypothetical protein
MMRTKLFLISLAILLLGFSLVRQVGAQANDQISSLSILIWPEYDDPSVLVQYDGEFANKAAFPRQVSFYLPTGANIIASAYVTATGDFLNTEDPKVEDAGNNFSKLSVMMPTSHFHFEYYYNPLKGSPDKTMEFVYKAFQATNAIHVEVQQPLKSEKFLTVPAGTTQTSKTHGFSYSLIDFPGLKADDTVSVKVSYTKSDPNPSTASISTPNATPSATSSSASATNSSSQWVVPAILVSVGLAVGALGFYYWWSRRSLETKRLSAGAVRRGKARNAGRASAFCTNCGNALDDEDVFCSRCGTRRR